MYKPITGLNIPASRYELYPNTKSLIAGKIEEYDARELMTQLGRTNYSKFARRLQEYKSLSTPIPVELIYFIGLELNDIDCAIEYDKAEYYAQVRSSAINYRRAYFNQRWAVKSFNFEDDLCEDEAIQRCLELIYEADGRFPYLILTTQYYEVMVSSEGIKHNYYLPSYSIKNNHISFYQPLITGLSI
ncbi:hypothetical protein OAQ99_04705 [Candidatus Kapabacteria bacterium]|nr:hypothetical protein [Candidatus Kapabacteria bacterium]